MKLFESTHIFAHRWDKLTLASFRKYPNPFSPHVVSVDVVNRFVDTDTGECDAIVVAWLDRGFPFALAVSAPFCEWLGFVSLLFYL